MKSRVFLFIILFLTALTIVSGCSQTQKMEEKTHPVQPLTESLKTTYNNSTENNSPKIIIQEKNVTKGNESEKLEDAKENKNETDTLNTTSNEPSTPQKEEITLKKEEISWYKPKPGISWQWQLSGKINTEYDVDLYDIDLVETPKETIEELQRKGAKVICYFSAGSWEDFRDDADEFPREVIGKTLEGWPDERWLDISNYEKFADIMRKRLDLAVEKGCDGVEPDNVDAYQNDNGFGLTYDNQLAYNKWLAEEAHKRGLAIGLKNDLDQVRELEPYFDFAINEQCFEYDECEKLLPFVKAGKAVLGVEYELEPEEFCGRAKEMNFSWLKMDYDLDGSRIACE